MSEASVNVKGTDFDKWFETEVAVKRFGIGRRAANAGVTITSERDLTIFHLFNRQALHPACKCGVHV